MPKKIKKKAPRTQPSYILTICNDCRIRLVVPAEKASCCGLCKSKNISKEAWR